MGTAVIIGKCQSFAMWPLAKEARRMITIGAIQSRVDERPPTRALRLCGSGRTSWAKRSPPRFVAGPGDDRQMGRWLDTGRRIRTGRSDDESGRCCGSGAYERCRSSPPRLDPQPLSDGAPFPEPWSLQADHHAVLGNGGPRAARRRGGAGVTETGLHSSDGIRRCVLSSHHAAIK